jgi:hypothetical protein
MPKAINEKLGFLKDIKNSQNANLMFNKTRNPFGVIKPIN